MWLFHLGICKLKVVPATGQAPLATLRSILLHLRDPERLSRVQGRLLEYLAQRQVPDDTQDILLAPWQGELTADLRQQLRKSFRTHLFGRDTLLSQRLSIMLAAFCQVRASIT